jgi:hypothetical protein
MFQVWKFSLIATFAFSATNVWAEDDGSFTNYDAIVNELKADAEYNPEPLRDELGWEEVAISGGMALATSFISITAPNGASGGGMLNGFELFGGANLFSKKARGEIGIRSFAPGEFGKVNVNLREIEARLMFLPVLREKLTMRMGMGITARYMDVDGQVNGVSVRSEATTPASALILGLERKLSPAITIGPDLAYRSALTASFDKSAWDAAIRLNATF